MSDFLDKFTQILGETAFGSLWPSNDDSFIDRVKNFFSFVGEVLNALFSGIMSIAVGISTLPFSIAKILFALSETIDYLLIAISQLAHKLVLYLEMIDIIFFFFVFSLITTPIIVTYMLYFRITEFRLANPFIPDFSKISGVTVGKSQPLTPYAPIIKEKEEEKKIEDEKKKRKEIEEGEEAEEGEEGEEAEEAEEREEEEEEGGEGESLKEKYIKLAKRALGKGSTKKLGGIQYLGLNLRKKPKPKEQPAETEIEQQAPQQPREEQAAGTGLETQQQTEIE
jgi:hypothetical protein